MARIGAGWVKEDKNKKDYISWSVYEELQPLTLTGDKKLISRINNDKTDSKQPDYFLEIFVPQKDKSTQKEEENHNGEYPF